MSAFSFVLISSWLFWFSRKFEADCRFPNATTFFENGAENYWFSEKSFLPNFCRWSHCHLKEVFFRRLRGWRDLRVYFFFKILHSFSLRTMTTKRTQTLLKKKLQKKNLELYFFERVKILWEKSPVFTSYEKKLNLVLYIFWVAMIQFSWRKKYNTPLKATQVSFKLFPIELNLRSKYRWKWWTNSGVWTFYKCAR